MNIVKLIKYPGDEEWDDVKRRAFVTIGKEEFTPPTWAWKKKILKARHSPIRCLQFSFYIECPYWVTTHLSRHKHAEPYIRSQRNDRQDLYDRNAARQDEPVQMIWDMNAEELITIANKRLCMKAAAETRQIVEMMCEAVKEMCPEFTEELVPICERENVCHEMNSCGKKATVYRLKETIENLHECVYNQGYSDGVKSAQKN